MKYAPLNIKAFVLGASFTNVNTQGILYSYDRSKCKRTITGGKSDNYRKYANCKF